MPTVDRKNTDTDEKHSLSSFDKRKVQSVTFGAKQLERKKYRVVKHETLPPRAALKENVRCPVDNEVRAPLEHGYLYRKQQNRIRVSLPYTFFCSAALHQR